MYTPHDTRHAAAPAKPGSERHSASKVLPSGMRPTVPCLKVSSGHSSRSATAARLVVVASTLSIRRAHEGMRWVTTTPGEIQGRCTGEMGEGMRCVTTTPGEIQGSTRSCG